MKKSLLILFLCASSVSCKDYLDVVPDNVATIEYAFRLRSTAERYLFTCYSFLPNSFEPTFSPALMGGDELWLPSYPFREFETDAWEIAMGNQNINAPLLDYWNGGYMGSDLWRGIRECNIFLENIMTVEAMDEAEKIKWAAEAKFLKAYYHFYLLRMYGPIPIVKQNIPISAESEEVRVQRRPVDEVMAYIVQLIDEAAKDLPPVVTDENTEMGRITQPIALGMKAKMLVYAASPLFNGNPDYAGFTNKDGTPLFNTTPSLQKWEAAAQACKEAIDLCQSLGYKLYEFEGTVQTGALSPETKTKMSIRNAFAERWNSEIIWANSRNGTALVQRHATPSGLDPAGRSNATPRGSFAVPLKIAVQFYTRNGLPIQEDVTWKYEDRYKLREGTAAEKYYIKEGYTTAHFNFDREPRFYANLGFDGGIWYGQGKFNDADSWYLQSRVGGIHGKVALDKYSITGYYPKKYVHYSNVIATTGSVYTVRDASPINLRLADLFLLYAEALNEATGPGVEVYRYLDLVRHRAGLPGLVESWTNYAKNPGKVNTKDGLREIIRQERGNELALEGERFWDLRRWKTALEIYNMPITGWDVTQENPESYYREKTLFRQRFSLKDYFWPIRERDLIVNKNLVQNPGW